MKTSELTGAALDWAVAKCEGGEFHMRTYKGDNPGAPFPAIQWAYDWQELSAFQPSTDWALGGPIIEWEKISLEYLPGAGDAGADVWVATRAEGPGVSEEQGDKPLVAAMRCYVASQLGDEVDVPEELLRDK